MKSNPVLLHESFDRQNKILLKVKNVVVHILPNNELTDASAVVLQSLRMGYVYGHIFLPVDYQSRAFYRLYEVYISVSFGQQVA